MARRKSERESRPAVAVGYIRVSTGRQANGGVSLAAQAAAIRSWCRVHGYDLRGVYEDRGVSGKSTDNRPELEAALAEAETERAAFVVHSLSRASRTLSDLLKIAERLKRAGGDFVSLTESIDTTSPTGELVFHLLSSLAQFERRLAGARTKVALSELKKEGKHVGRPPRGKRVGESGKLEVDPDSPALKLYRRARELRDEGLSYARVAEQLTKEKFAPGRQDAGKARKKANLDDKTRVKAIAPATVYALLKNPGGLRRGLHVAPAPAGG